MSDQTRLDSWKAIGAYLQRDERTVRRWEKDEGLPIHRHSHKSRSSVYAYASEIDAWRVSRKVVPEPAPARPLWKIPAFAVTMLLCLIMVGNGIRPQVASAQGGPIARLVCTDCGDSYVGFEGRTLVFTDWDSGDLAVRDLISGRVTRLQAKTGSFKDSRSYASYSVISPDARQVAYLWEPGEDPLERDIQLRVIANEPEAKSRVLMEGRENKYYQPFGWSADGRFVFVVVQKRLDSTWQILRVSANDGAATPLKSLQWRFQGAFQGNSLPRVSPDGRYIAYSALALNPSKVSGAPADAQDQHIYILATDGSSESEVVKTTGFNWNPVWTSDGKHLLFLSNRTGERGLWSLPVGNGKALASPAVVTLNLGSGAIWPIGTTRSGSYYYAQWSGDVEQIAVADLRTGKPSETLVGTNPSWSPDGKLIAFKRHRPGSERGATNDFDLVVHSLESGDEKTFSPAFGAVGTGQPAWLHNNRGLLTRLRASGSSAGEYRVDLEPSEWKQFSQMYLAVTVLSPDDQTRYSLHRDSIVATDSVTDTERQIYAVPHLVSGDSATLALSPDGRTLAFWSMDQPGGQARLNTVGVDGTNFREVRRFEDARNVSNSALAWNPDGQAIFVALKSDDKWRIVRIPTKGSQPEFTGIETTARIQAFSLNPEGSKIVYSSAKDQKDAVRAFDNVVSSLK